MQEIVEIGRATQDELRDDLRELFAYSTESGHLFQLKAVTCSDALRPQMAERSEGVRSGTGEALS